jgi:hypothetical protein
MMAGKIDLEKFSKVAEVRGDDGRWYTILIEGGLVEEIEEKILARMALGELELRGHIYVPREPGNGSLKSDSD